MYLKPSGVHVQVECGAQVLQVFESWAHHLSEEQFLLFAKPYAAKIAAYLKAKHPTVPVVYFANGGSCFLHQQLDMGMHALSVDWRISMAHARAIAGRDTVLAGNIDPMVLYGSEKAIESAIEACAKQAGLGGKHVLNLGHGVEQDTPERAVQCFVDAARRLTTYPQ
jgi:uroporphyrinogen-III decarboxylase